MKIKMKNMHRGICGFKTTLPANYIQSKIDNLTYTKSHCLCGFDGIFLPIKKHRYDRLSLGGVD